MFIPSHSTARAEHPIGRRILEKVSSPEEHTRIPREADMEGDGEECDDRRRLGLIWEAIAQGTAVEKGRRPRIQTKAGKQRRSPKFPSG
jgi:hypothetical protein